MDIQKIIHFIKLWQKETTRRGRIQRSRRKARKNKRGGARYLGHKAAALALVEERIAHFNAHYNFTFGRITIRNQAGRWGSCSRKGNLNFNYKIVLLPERLSDYIIVHELCHLGEFNHSQNFWNLVGEMIPDYRELRVELKQKGLKFY